MGLKDSLIQLASAVASNLLRSSSPQHPEAGETTRSKESASPKPTTPSAARPSPASRPASRPTESASSTKSGNTRENTRPTAPKQSTRETGPTLTVTSRSRLPGPGEIPMVYDVSALGLPNFRYAPREDDEPDPGEIVWTWVPYEEDRSQGKDRPVLVLAEDSGRLVFAQLTSKDNVQHGVRQDRHGNSWLDISAGAWDSRRRPSEVRLDRLLCVHPSQVRREGARLNATCFTEVIGAITEVHC